MTADRITEARARLTEATAKAERDEQARIVRGHSPTATRLDNLSRVIADLRDANNHNVGVADARFGAVREAFAAERARSRALAEALYVILGRVQYLEQRLDAVAGADEVDDDIAISPWVAEWHAATDPDVADAILVAHRRPQDPDPIAEMIWRVAA